MQSGMHCGVALPCRFWQWRCAAQCIVTATVTPLCITAQVVIVQVVVGHFSPHVLTPDCASSGVAHCGK